MISRKRYARRAGPKAISLAAVAFLALGVLGVSSALGSNSFTTAQRNWGIGPFPGVQLVGARPVAVSSNALLFQSTLLGTPVEWTASGIECSNCKIENRNLTGKKAEAVFSGQMSLTGVKSIKPANCTMPSTLGLRQIIGVLGGSSQAGDVAAELYPYEGATTWTSYEYGGANCMLRSTGVNYLTGTAFTRFKNALGVASKSQEISLSQALQEYLGSSSSMRFAGNPAFLSASIKLTEEEEFLVSEKETSPVTGENLFTTPSKNPTVPRNWYTGAQPGTKLVGVQAAETSLASETLTFNTTIAGSAVKFSASGVECSGCKIENRTGTGENISNTEGAFSGSLTFTGLKMLSSPGNCSMPSTMKTKPLTGVLGGQKGSSTKATVRITPTTGAGTSFGTFELIGCPDEGVYKMTGTWFGELGNPLGVNAKTQRIRFSQPIQELLGTPTSLKFGENRVFVNGEVNLSSAVEFQVKEQ